MGLPGEGIQVLGSVSRIKVAGGRGEESMGAESQMLGCDRVGEQRNKPLGSERKAGTIGHRWKPRSGHQSDPWLSKRGLT